MSRPTNRSSQSETIQPSHLPPPPPGKTGWPWTGVTPALPPSLSNGSAWPRITVVTPSFEQGRYLEETIRSVLLQGYPDLEYIIIDGGSADNSIEIIQKYAGWLAYWVSEPDQGQASAINKGFSRSTGAIMGWLNSDDILLPNALRHTAEAFVRDPSVMITTGFRKMYDADSRFLRNWFLGLPDREYLRHYCVVAQETTYWRRAVWEDVGPLDETLSFAMDYEYWQRVLDRDYEFTLLRHYLGGFRTHPEGKTSAWKDVRAKEIAQIYQRYDVAQDESEVLARQADFMGNNYSAKRRLLKDVLHKPISDNPTLLLLIVRISNLPGISHVLIALHRLYKRYLR